MGLAIGSSAWRWQVIGTVKNAILFGNPIFPFCSAIPACQTNIWQDYLQEMTRPFDPADRIYSTNLAKPARLAAIRN